MIEHRVATVDHPRWWYEMWYDTEALTSTMLLCSAIDNKYWVAPCVPHTIDGVVPRLRYAAEEWVGPFDTEETAYTAWMLAK